MSDRIDDVIRSLEDDPVPAWWRSDVACLITEVRRRRASAPPQSADEGLVHAAEEMLSAVAQWRDHPSGRAIMRGQLAEARLRSALSASRDGTASPSAGADTKGGT